MCFIGARTCLKIKGREENIAYFTGFLFFTLFFGVIFDLSQVLLVFLMFYTVFRGSGFRVQEIMVNNQQSTINN